MNPKLQHIEIVLKDPYLPYSTATLRFEGTNGIHIDLESARMTRATNVL